jgi:hypothetical protein
MIESTGVFPNCNFKSGIEKTIEVKNKGINKVNSRRNVSING